MVKAGLLSVLLSGSFVFVSHALLLRLPSCLSSSHRGTHPTTIRLAVIPSQNEHTLRQLIVPAKNGPVGLYMHIPFCRRRCRYCDFAIVPIGPNTQEGVESSGFLQMAHNYTQAVLSEIHKIRNDKPILVHSIYFGGGTPSLAPIETLTELVRAIQSSPNFDISQSAEWTMEMDPGTFDVAKLQTIRDLGFNRISLGVQSFDDTMLESLGRVHRLKDIQDSLSMLAQVFGNNVNYSLDLISALPGLTLAHWTETLQTAVLLDPAPRHISIYDLQIESGTVFGKWYETKDGDKKKSTNRQRSSTANTTTAPLPSDADASFMYRYASGYLAARNFEHYEVSSYARLIDNQQVSPWRSQHNQIYWTTNGQWYAFGLGATSFVDGVMQARPRTLIDYTNWATEYTGSLDDDGDALMSRPTDLDFLQDIVLKRLRTKEGLDLDWVHAHFGDEHIVHAIRKGAELAIDLDLAKVDGSRLKLSDPDGLLFSNTIISTIFVECEAAFDAKDTAKIKQL